MTMREVKLYGHLGKTFGKVFRFDVKTVAEAIAALKANLEGFEAYLLKHSKPGYHIFVDKRNLGEKDLPELCGKGTIKIIPAVAGAKRGGVLQTIIGAIMVIVGTFVPGMQWMIQPGIALMAGGIVQMLVRPPGRSETEKPDNRPSYSFNGPVNTTTQGNPIPVCYGELVVGSQVASMGLAIEDIYIPPKVEFGQNGIPTAGPTIGYIDTPCTAIYEIGTAPNTNQWNWYDQPVSEHYFILTPTHTGFVTGWRYNVLFDARDSSGQQPLQVGCVYDAAQGGFIIRNAALTLDKMPNVGWNLSISTPADGGYPIYNYEGGG